MKNNTVYIYALINPLDNQVFYIGATLRIQLRYVEHHSFSNYGYGPGVQKERAKLIAKIKVESKEMEFLILDTCDINDAAFYESFYIDLFRSYGFKLLQIPNRLYTLKLPVLEKTNIDKWIDKNKYSSANRLIDGKDIHHYRREIIRNFKFYEHSNHQT